MYVKVVENLEALQPLRARWDTVAAGVVFRTWTWLSTWWRHYGEMGSRQLHVLLVWEGDQAVDCEASNCTGTPCSDPDKLIAILPCYLDSNLTRGRVLRLLGDGEVCSDHLDLLTTGLHAKDAANTLGQHLTQAPARWDAIDMPTLDVSRDDCKLHLLFEALSQRGCQVNHTADVNSWSIELPETWDEFLTLQSKSHRKQLRRLDKRVLATEDCQWHQVSSIDEFDEAWEIFIDLHQRRRISLGEPGCFASKRWGDFHKEVAQQLLEQGQLRLNWLELGGQPIAVEYHFADGRTTYVYQGGLDPQRLDEEPGRLSMIRTIQQAIDEGHRKFDLLRGDEPYKPHWRATAKETVRVQVVPNRTTAQLRHKTWTSLRGASRWVRQITHLFN